VVAVLVAVTAMLTGCGEGERGEGPQGKAGGAPEGGRVLGVTFMSLSNPFFQSCKQSIEAVATDHGDEIMVVNAEYKAAGQLSGVENMVQAGVACLLLNPVNSDAAASAVLKANQAGTPVVTFDVTATKGEVACFVESNNYLAGELCADYIGWRLKGEGKIVLLDHPEVSSVRQRTAGFKDHLAKAWPNVEIAVTQLGKGRKEVGLQVTENIVRANPDIDAIFAINDPSALGATQAVKAAKIKDVFVVGIDGAPDAVAELKKEDSPFAMTVAQFPKEIGRVATEMAYKVIAGQEDVPEHIKVPVMPVTRENMDVYPGWEGGLPEDIEIPWKSTIEIKRETE
jgi:ribose transport system substrate-binding protein